MDLRELLNLDKKLIFLENVNEDKLGVLNAHDVKFSPRFNSISTLSFRVYEDECLYYKQITSWRRIELQDIMKFIIEKPLEFNDGLRKYKEITCRSYEIDINRKVVPLLQGTFKFYSQIVSDKTICSIFMSYLPNWTLEHVDSSLWNLYRTFDLQDRPLYQMMMEDIENSFECVFLFDTLNQTIEIRAFENIPIKSDIYLSFDNLVNELNITEDTESLITSISVLGGNDLSINMVNPLGNTIYNFQHFATIEYMPESLVNAINSWHTLIDSKQTEYSNYLIQRKTKISERITLETQLIELESQLKALTEVRDTLLDSGLNASSKNTEVKAKQIEINNKKTDIKNKQTEVNNIDLSLQNIQNTIAIDKYFTQAQLLELEPFIINMSVTDENFTKVDTDTDLDIQETAQDLYDKYKKYLDKASRLNYKFSIDLINFLQFEEYRVFTNQLQWGTIINLETETDNGIAYPMLLGLDISLDEKSDMQFLFGEELRYESLAMSYEDYTANQLSNVSNLVNGSSIKWGEYVRSGSKDRLNSIFESGLRADLTQIINSEKQETIINQQGFLGRKYISDGVYEDEQIKITNNRIGFTDNNFDSLKTVIGKVTLPDGSTAFGGNAEIWMGKLIASNSLIITNANNKFLVDASGATLTDATLSILNSSGLNKILLDPNNGFKIQKNINNVFIDMVYFDTEGNLKIKGYINASDITGSKIHGNSITGGSIFIGGLETAANCNFGVTEAGKILGLETVNGLFSVDSYGYAVFNNGIKIGEALTINADGSMIWGSPVVQYQYSVDNLSWHTTMTSSDKYRRESWDSGATWQSGYQFIGIDGINGIDANVPGYIHETYIDSTTIISPTIETNLLTIQIPNQMSSTSGLLIKGYYDSINHNFLKIGYYDNGTPYVTFNSPDSAYAQWNFGSTWFNNNIHFGNSVSFSNGAIINFDGATVQNLNVTGKFG